MSFDGFNGFLWGLMIGISFMAYLNTSVINDPIDEKTLIELQIESKKIEIKMLKDECSKAISKAVIY
tara:strand:- start:55 stop:255 length:201 start_codon:yes stop_codon:yes gene_type:complete